MNSTEKILLTGVTGHVGPQVVSQLAGGRLSLRALVRHPEKAAGLHQAGVEVVTGDLADMDTVKKALAGVSRLLVMSTAAPELAELQSHLAGAAADCGVQYIVKVSAVGADPQSNINTARWHGQAEEAILGTGIRHCFLRSSGYMQNLLGMSRVSKTGGTFPTHRTNAREAMIDNRDVAACIVEVLTGDDPSNTTYELTGPESFTIAEVARAISEVAENAVTPNVISEDEYRAMMLGYGMPEWITNDMIAWGYMTQEPTQDVAALTGRPATSLHQFLQDHADVFRR